MGVRGPAKWSRAQERTLEAFHELALRGNETPTYREVAETTGLSLAVVKYWVERLVERGVLVENGRAATQSRRVQLAQNRTAKLVAAARALVAEAEQYGELVVVPRERLEALARAADDIASASPPVAVTQEGAVNVW